MGKRRKEELMIYIGICDDEDLHRQHIKEMCKRFFTELAQEYKCVEFTSGEEVLQFSEHKLHLLFLDIEMGNISGIDVLHRVEEADIVWRVVFISSHEECVFDTFGIKTLGFIRKPAEYDQIARWIRVALKENKENIIYECITEQQKFYISLEKIFYLEAAGNYTFFFERDQKHLVSDKLKVWQEKMERTSMVRIHKSYLINMLYVKKWETDKVVLVNGVNIPLGRQYKKVAKDVYFEFVRRQAIGRI